MKKLINYLKNDYGIFTAVIFLGFISAGTTYTITLFKGTITPIGLYGMPFVLISFLIALFSILFKKECLDKALLLCYAITSAYFNSLLAYVVFSEQGLKSTTYDLLLHAPLLYILAHYFVKEFANIASWLNFLCFVCIYLISEMFFPKGNLEGTSDLVFKALMGHPIYLVALQYMVNLKNKADQLEIREKTLSGELMTDPLTQVGNRVLLSRIFKDDESARIQGDLKRLSIILIDADHFKRVNDTLGHSKGDWVLQEIAKVLKQSIRPGDIVARWGGEEFVIIPQDGSKTGAKQIAQRVLEGVRAIEVGGGLPNVSVSIGVASRTKEGESIQTIFNMADTAVYEAKHSGRNQICFAKLT